EHDADPVGSREAETLPGRDRARRHEAEGAEGGRQHAVEAVGAVVGRDERGRQRAGRRRGGHRAVAAESARANATAARTASRPSAWAEIRTTTSSGVIEPV